MGPRKLPSRSYLIVNFVMQTLQASQLCEPQKSHERHLFRVIRKFCGFTSLRSRGNVICFTRTSRVSEVTSFAILHCKLQKLHLLTCADFLFDLCGPPLELSRFVCMCLFLPPLLTGESFDPRGLAVWPMRTSFWPSRICFSRAQIFFPRADLFFPISPTRILFFIRGPESFCGPSSFVWT